MSPKKSPTLYLKNEDKIIFDTSYRLKDAKLSLPVEGPAEEGRPLALSEQGEPVDDGERTTGNVGRQ